MALRAEGFLKEALCCLLHRDWELFMAVGRNRA